MCDGVVKVLSAAVSRVRMDEKPSAVELCEICGDVSDGLHFGINTCRACAAFFRRSVSLKLDYKCKTAEQCELDKEARNSCRYCRFQKCLRKGMQIKYVQLSRDGLGKRSHQRSRSPIHTMVTSSDDTNRPSTSCQHEMEKPVMLQKMLEGYEHFLTIRRTTSSLIAKPNTNLTFGNCCSEEELRPSNFDTSKKVSQMEAHLVADIINTYFQPFETLNNEDKVTLFQSFFCLLSHTDRAYQSFKRFGHLEDDDRILMPDGGFIKCSQLEQFYANADGVHSSPDEAAKIFRPAVEFILHVIIVHMKRMEIDDLEYMAILGFFLWNEAVTGLQVSTLDIIVKAQNNILDDLHKYYRGKNMAGIAITRRIGQLMLLLPKLTKSVAMLRENAQMAELFNIFEGDICCKSFGTP